MRSWGSIGLAVAVGDLDFVGYNLSFGVLEAIGSLLRTPAFALLLIGLLPTYAELRARETRLSTPALAQQFG